MTRALIALIALLHGPVAVAQHRTHRRVQPPGPAPLCLVARTEHTSLREARAELPRHTDAIAACLRDASRRDPVRLSHLHTLQAFVTLTLRSRAETVEIEPARLPPGLSLCLADALRTWAQRSASSPRARVELRITLSALE